MFKEFGVMFFILIITILLLRRLYGRHYKYYRYITAGMLVVAVALNAGYNLRQVYPVFLYEGVPIGDSEENLFVYKKDSQFQWHILNTISQNRSILLDEDGILFEHYFDLFAEEVDYIQIPEKTKELIKEREEFLYQCDLGMVEQLDYAFPLWQGGEKPRLYMHEDSLPGEQELVFMVIADKETMDVYLMSEKYYRNFAE